MTNKEITIDGFCGGGGWSTGFEIAIGEPVTIGINHDADAIAMHKANHPETRHYNENIFEVDPREACAGRPVGWAHFSPDCTHFSVAKGGKPVKKTIRGLAWVVVKWAGTVKPRIISMENVKEFMTWCPLVAKRGECGRVIKIDGTEAERGEYVPLNQQYLKPDKRRKGETFRKFIKAMKSLGYEVEWKVLTASDYGAPTSRKRLFIIFRRGGKPIVFPKPTHGDPKSEAVKSGELLPWRTAAECIDWSHAPKSIFEREKPLAEATLARIARGIKKFIAENPEPFILNFKFDNSPEDICKPLSSMTTVRSHYVVEPHIIHLNHSKDNFRGQRIDKPLPTLTSKQSIGVVASFMCKHYGGGYTGAGSALKTPLDTITATDHNAVVGATLIQTGYGERQGQAPRVPGIDKPLGTIVSANKHAVIAAYMDKRYGDNGGARGSDLNSPLDTVTKKDHNQLVEIFLEKHGLVSDIEIYGEKYKITDICMRMLEPRELYRAQGFPDDYIIEYDCNGNKFPKSKQVAKCGNSVPPAFATALVRANWAEKCGGEQT
ncbi:MAG: DNA cytosine methyltransferase [Oscillospiraceae bacterium]|nr:DNA cytosine methyltransferase [Oscillospiraceae bacterium]